jgi:protein N-lysine methyltransferase METTL21A
MVVVHILLFTLTFLSIELGAGGGLVGLAVARGSQITKPLIITDQLPMLGLMQQNIALNSLEERVIAGRLDWGTSISPSLEAHFSTHASLPEERFPDVVLAADCVYFEPAFPLLLQTMHRLLGPETLCYFCFKKRRKADWRFIRDMKKQFEVVDAIYDDQHQDKRDGIYLYEVRRKPKSDSVQQ